MMIKITSVIRRMVADREFAEAVAEYVHAIDRLKGIEAKQREAVRNYHRLPNGEVKFQD